MSDVSACPTCRMVRKIGVWGPFKVAAWKRRALLLLSSWLILGLSALAVFFVAPSGASWQWFVVVPMLGLGVLGFVVGLRGCEDCVSRVFGGI